MSKESLIEVTVSDFIAIAALDNPPVNAMSRALRRQIVAVFDELGDRDDVRVIILTGKGKLFCAGADLKDRPDIDKPGDFPDHNRVTREMLNVIRDCPKPVICAVNGGALGGGFGLMAYSDIMLASEEAFFSLPEINVGLAGGAAMLKSILPKSKARYLLFSGERISAIELYRLGVLEACVPADQLMARSLEIARNLSSKSATAMSYAKQSANLADLMSISDAYLLEQKFTASLGTSQEATEARARFFDKSLG